ERNHFAELHRFEVVEVARVRAVINHAAHHGEQQPGDDAVREHLQHRAIEADGVERREAEQHEAHVAHAGIADDEFEILLHQRHARAIHDAGDGETGDFALPHAHAFGKHHHRHAQAAVSAEL